MGRTAAAKAPKKGWAFVDLNDIDTAPWNYKTEDESKAAALLANIKRNKQLENLIVREMPKGRFEAVNGNHRLPAFREAGLTRAMCFNLGQITEIEAARIAVETNETRFASDQL